MMLPTLTPLQALERHLSPSPSLPDAAKYEFEDFKYSLDGNADDGIDSGIHSVAKDTVTGMLFFPSGDPSKAITASDYWLHL